MTLEILLYIIGAGLIPVIVWAIHSYITQRDIQTKVGKLLEMHENPDVYGFGTVGMKALIEENTRALKALTHYIKWLEVRKTGEEPPPPIGD